MICVLVRLKNTCIQKTPFIKIFELPLDCIYRSTVDYLNEIHVSSFSNGIVFLGLKLIKSGE